MNTPVAGDAAHDLATAERRLRQILEPYRGQLEVTKEGPGGFALEIPGLAGKPFGYVAGTRLGKRYVSHSRKEVALAHRAEVGSSGQ